MKTNMRWKLLLILWTLCTAAAVALRFTKPTPENFASYIKSQLNDGDYGVTGFSPFFYSEHYVIGGPKLEPLHQYVGVLGRFYERKLVKKAISVNNGTFDYMVFNGTITIMAYTGSGGVVTIPGKIDGLQVTSIGFDFGDGQSGVFKDCTALTSAMIPDSVLSIGNYAFAGCTNLSSVTIPNSVTSIGVGAFEDCDSLANISLPASVTRIGDEAFYGCDSMTSITVDKANSAYTVVDGVLFNQSQTVLILYPARKSGSSYTIPDGVTYVESGAFLNCTSLTSLWFPDSVVGMARNSVGGQTPLHSVNRWPPDK